MIQLQRWAAPPTFLEDDRNFLALLTHTVMVLTVVFTVLGSLMALIVSSNVLRALVPSGTILLLEFVAIYVLWRGKVRVAAWLMTTFLWAGVAVVVVLMGGLAAGTLPLLLVAVVIAVLTTGRWGSVLFSTLTGVFVSVLHVLQVTTGPLPLVLGATNLNTWVSAMTAVMATGVFVRVAVRSLQASNLAANEHRERLQTLVERLQASTVSQAYMDSIIQSMYDMLLVVDRDLKIKTVNRAVLDQLGYAEADLLGKPLWFLLQEGKGGTLQQRLSRHTFSTAALYLVTSYRTHDGGTRPVRLTISQMQDAGPEKRLLCVAQDLTDLMQTQRDLRHERNLLRTLLDSLPDYIHVKSLDGRYMVSNRAHATLIGMDDPSEIIGQTSAKIFGDEIAEQYLADDDYVLRTGEPVLGVERRGVDADGNTIWFYTNKVPLRDDDGALTGIVAIATDITQRKQDEARLLQSEARNRALLAAMPDTVLVLDDRGTHIEVKAENTADLLAPPQNLVGQRITDLLPDGHPLIHRYLSAIQRCLVTGALQSLTYTLGNTLGGHDHFETRVVRLNEKEVVCVVRNITDQHEAELEIREREAMYRTLARNLPRTAVMLYDHDLRYLIAEGEALNEVGYDRELMEGKRLPDLYPDIYERYGADYQQALNGETVHYDLDVPSVQKHYTVTFMPIRNDYGVIFAGMVVGQDVTASRRQTQEIRQYAAALEHSNDELANFAYIASHDLQEPLRKIQVFGGRLADYLGDTLDPTAADYLARMTNAAERMQQLIADLLALSRVTTQAKPFRPVDIYQVWVGVKADLEVQIEQAGATIIETDLPTIEAEKSQIRQLLQNLLGNALKYRRAHTPLQITLSVSYPTPQQVTLMLADNGIGFNSAYAERIFGPFQRLHGRSQYTGTGMGLAICRKIVERHKGTITAHGEPGRGAFFMVTLPRKQPQTTNEDSHAGK
jgi:PAS domain S-box-containing protein